MRQTILQILKRVQLHWYTKFSNKKLIGTDKVGNKYFEEARDSFPRRTVELNDGSKHYDAISSSDLPVQWRAWLRHTRSYPPTHQEIAYHDNLRISTLHKAKLLEEKFNRGRLGLPKGKPNQGLEMKVEENEKVEENPIKEDKLLNKKNEQFQPESWNPTITR